MRLGKILNNILAIAVLCGGIYVLMNWESIRPQDDPDAQYAERSCMTEIQSRFDATSANVYSVTEKDAGYVVRASMTLPRGNAVKVICLANEHGRITEVRVDER